MSADTERLRHLLETRVGNAAADSLRAGLDHTAVIEAQVVELARSIARAPANVRKAAVAMLRETVEGAE